MNEFLTSLVMDKKSVSDLGDQSKLVKCIRDILNIPDISCDSVVGAGSSSLQRMEKKSSLLDYSLPNIIKGK